MKYIVYLIFLILFNFPISASISLITTESDPDAFVHGVNVINGEYCESATDLIITGPDILTLRRFYSSNVWRINPERILVIGKEPFGKSCEIDKVNFEKVLAFAGERSGGILPYSGWRSTSGFSKDPLKINHLNAIGMVNTYAEEMNGQSNHLNNLLTCQGATCELILGDGTKRIYQKVAKPSALILGEELIPSFAAQVVEPEYYFLMQETLPSGNHIFFIYDNDSHLISIEMKNKNQTKTHSWIKFSYNFQNDECQIDIETSDTKTLTYRMVLDNGIYQLVKAEGSHLIPTAFEYNGVLVKRIQPLGRFIEIEYQEGKVKALKGPHYQTGETEINYTFYYGNEYTDVINSIKTRYIHDDRLQLIAIERYDEQNNLYRVERKYWGVSGLLRATTIEDGKGQIHSYHSFKYDEYGNVIEERLYGNLTGKQEASLQVNPDGELLNQENEECHFKSFGYSKDGLNLLTQVGDFKGNQTLYFYEPETNLLIKKFIYEKDSIRRRLFQEYNEDAVCIKIVEDNGSTKNNTYDWSIDERHIKEFRPKENLPGVGLPEIIEEKVFDIGKKKEILVKKLINTFDDQSNLLTCSTYDANDQYAFTESKTYNFIGEITSDEDKAGNRTDYTYDEIGNLIRISSKNQSTDTTYDFHNQPTEINSNGQIHRNCYDARGRKISSVDRFGNPTIYEYDAFDRLIKVIHPEVLDENNQVIRPTFVYTYDLFGNVLTIQDPKGFITSKSYNLRNKPTKIEYPDGSYELFKYDPEGSLHRSLTRDQIITVYEYDYLGRLVHEESSTSDTGELGFIKGKFYKYNGFRCIEEKQDKFLKRYFYDPAGRIAILAEHPEWSDEKKSDSHKTEIMYDSLGRIQQKKVWFDGGRQDYFLESFEWDPLGNVLEKKIQDAQGKVLLQRGFLYNSQGMCIEEFSLENSTKVTLSQTVFGINGEPISYVDALGQETKVCIDEAYRNSLGQNVLKKTIVSCLGVQTELEFDALGRMYSICKKDPFGVLLSCQKILYDSLGNKACEINEQIVQGQIQGVQKNRWYYGPLGRLDEVVEAVDTPLEQRTRYSYNSLGQMTCKNTGTPINYSYNKEGVLHKIEAKDSKKELQISNTYTFDRINKIELTTTLQGISVERSYNCFDQMIRETFKDGDLTYSIRFSYDRLGRIKEVKLPDNSKIAYTFVGPFGREVKRMSEHNDVLYSHTYDQFDQQGKLLAETLPGNLGKQEYTYDPNGNKKTIKSDLFSEDSERDLIGRLTEINGKKKFAYNDLSQLVSENNKTFEYDSLDNRIKINNDELIYNGLNQLKSHCGTEYFYDLRGNLSKKVQNKEETRLESNALSQLISVENSNRLIFSYDPFGRLLVEKQIDIKNNKTLSTTHYLYFGNQEIGSISEKGSIENLKVPGLNGLDSIAFELKGKRYVPMHDLIGNVISLLDPQSRDVIECYQYTAFGKETIYNGQGEVKPKSQVGNPWRFAEKRFNEILSLIHFGFRFYDPTIGRWISQDPAGFIDGSNLYAYLHNNPLSYFDRFGLAAEDSSTKFNKYFFGEVETHCHCQVHRTCKRGGDIGRTIRFSIPKITQDYSEKKSYSFSLHNEESLILQPYLDQLEDEPTKIYDLGLPELPDIGIGFINGITNSFNSAKKSAAYISRHAGGLNVHAVYNATRGLVADLEECGRNLCGGMTEPGRQLHKMWNSFFEKSSSNARFLMICHSQGAIHVRNALLDYPPELRERILVVAIAPGGYIYQKSCAQVVHYRVSSYRDPIPYIDLEGAIMNKRTIIEIDSVSKARWHDHSFNSPTYESHLILRIENYVESGGIKI